MAMLLQSQFFSLRTRTTQQTNELIIIFFDNYISFRSEFISSRLNSVVFSKLNRIDEQKKPSQVKRMFVVNNVLVRIVCIEIYTLYTLNTFFSEFVRPTHRTN